MTEQTWADGSQQVPLVPCGGCDGRGYFTALHGGVEFADPCPDCTPRPAQSSAADDDQPEPAGDIIGHPDLWSELRDDARAGR